MTLKDLLTRSAAEAEKVGPSVIKLLRDLAPELLRVKNDPAAIEEIAKTLVDDAPAIADAVKSKTVAANE